jgi:D-beta-D-heptose 7-phosphate kinase/D-beta-D-heptose 1-phosphate adenosyltransferase
MRLRPTSLKVVGLPRALALRRLWAREGLRVVFTNGVFDLLHPGHADLLENAAALGDRLVVGVNTDSSARRLEKGPDRPINPLRDRSRLLAALACVDAVVPFGEDTPERILSRLRPDVLVKGADYRKDQVAGRAHAGRVALVRLRKGYSTTALLARIRGAPRAAS